MQQLERLLKKSLVLQLGFYGLTLFTFYTASTQKDGNFSGLYGFIWLGFFGLLGVLNLVLIVLYISHLVREAKSPSRTIIILFILCIVAAATYFPVTGWLSTMV